MSQVLTKLHTIVEHELSADTSGHDWYHIERVVKLALHIASKEKRTIDLFIVEAAALLHDIADWKFHDGDETAGSTKARTILRDLQVPKDQIDNVCDIIDHISYKGAGVASPMSTIEGQIVQDADRLDAIGAIGIARAFAYGGHTGRPMHDPKREMVLHQSFAAYKKSASPTIAHFYEKLLLLKDRMNTTTGKKLAKQRHIYMESFLEEFYAEWNGKR